LNRYKIKYEGATLEAETGNDIEIEEAMIHGKRFIEGVARNTKNKGEGTSMYYILQVWADLGAGLARRGTPVSSTVSESIYHVSLKSLWTARASYSHKV
jgi:hypothetical protein